MWGLGSQNDSPILFVLMRSLAQTLFFRTLLSPPILRNSGLVLQSDDQMFSNTSFSRTLLCSDFGGLLLAQTFVWHSAACPLQVPFFGTILLLIRSCWRRNISVKPKCGSNLSLAFCSRGTKVWFCKRAVLANVPSFRVLKGPELSNHSFLLSRQPCRERYF